MHDRRRHHDPHCSLRDAADAVQHTGRHDTMQCRGDFTQSALRTKGKDVLLARKDRPHPSQRSGIRSFRSHHHLTGKHTTSASGMQDLNSQQLLHPTQPRLLQKLGVM